jgi:hypothetical protein
MKIIKIVLMGVLLALIVGCAAGKRERPEAPRLALQSMKVDGTQVSLQLRLTNQSFGPMVFERLTLDLSIAGVVAAKARVIELGALRVPGLGTEVVPLVINSADLAVASNQASLTYRLTGTAAAETGEYPFVLDSILNQVPGTPGEFR